MKKSVFSGLKNFFDGLINKESQASSPSVEEDDTKHSTTVTNPDSIYFVTRESVCDSFFGSVSEGSDSMLAQRVPASTSTPATHLPFSHTQKSNRALWEAALQNNYELCKDLLDHEIYGDLAADSNSKDQQGITALHISAHEGFINVCEVLLDYGTNTDLNVMNAIKRTPLHLACISGHTEVAQLLVRSGADINLVDIDGNTALHLATEKGHRQLVLWLLTRGPNIFIKNNEGRTPPDLAKSIEILDIFKDYCRRLNLPLPILGMMPISSHERYRSEPRRVTISDLTALEENKESGRVTPNDFEVIQELGKGSFGEVYLVRKQDNKNYYAMKVLRKDKVMGQNLIKYAMTERNVLSYVRHPFIVSLNYAFQTPEKLFLILDYASRGDLGSYLGKEKRFAEPLAKIYVCEVLLALEELHKRDIIFRDLKPDNIVLDNEGHAMLTDFGLSKEGIYDNVTARSFCGSVAYLAPEMIKRQGHGKAVDWYLLGVLLYEMLVGTPPYFSPNREELFRNIQRGLLKIPSHLSQETKDLLKELLQRDPSKRLGTRKDAEEVKEHSYFYGINWDSVLRRELRPSLPKKTPIDDVVIPNEKIYGDMSQFGDRSNQVTGWTFISN